ncbi:MAG: tetratricopeptide repeat protein [Planctomycetes bacterium]|nr:tetratricopeptide repeat protein [Planctomycetota bacterium]
MKVLLLLALLAQDDPIRRLQHKDPAVRRAGCDIIRVDRIQTAILPLIELLKEEDQPDVRDAAVRTLRELTQQSFGDSTLEWSRWWEAKGKEHVAGQTVTSEQVHQLMQPLLQDAKKDFEKSKGENRILLLVNGVAAVLFVVMMIWFAAWVSARIKAWKELVGRAEVYVQKSEGITQRTDQVIAELDAKKTDIMSFFGKVREDSQGELDRYGDMLQKNLEHTMREEVMALRQKAEKELQQTLGDVRAQVEMETRRASTEQKEKIDKAFQEQRERFIKEVEGHTLFLEASLYSIQGKTEDARRRYRELVQIKPDHVMAWNNLGMVCRELTRYDESLEALQQALKLAPNNSSVLYNLAATYARTRLKDKMLEALAQAIANDGEVKDEALNDAAFRDYWNDPAFKEIAE